MAYQRTEYADKTLSMNSLADRKLRLQLGSLDNHKGTIAKEINREKKKLERELAEAECYMRNRLAVGSPEGRQLSPRLPRRYSTPPSVLTASLPSQTDLRKSPLANRRRNLSDGLPDPLSSSETLNSPTSPSSYSPTSMNLLKPPFNQPRRQSLPPIGAGGLVAIEQMRKDELGIPRRDGRRGSYGGARTPGNSTSPISSGATTPRGGLSLSRKGSSLNEVELQEVTAKVSRFLHKIDSEKDKAKEENDNEEVFTELECNESETIQDLMADDTAKRLSSSGGTFHPLNFE